jgi:hypothetical protein
MDKNQAKREVAARNRAMLIKNRAEIARALEILFASGYISKKRLYIENFMRGMFFAVGTVVGLTIGVGFLLWVLSFFDQVPLIGPVFESLSNAIESGSSKGIQ